MLNLKTEVSSVAVATEVLGTAVIKAVGDYEKASSAAVKKSISMATQLNNDGITSAMLRAPKKDCGSVKFTVHGHTVTHQQVYDAMKLTLVSVRPGKTDMALWKAPKGSLSTDRSKAKATLQRDIGSRMSAVAKSLAKLEGQIQLDILQAEEDKKAKAEGREPEIVTANAGAKTRSLSVRIVDYLNKAKSLAQNAEGDEAEFDVTGLVKSVDAALAFIVK